MNFHFRFFCLFIFCVISFSPSFCYSHSKKVLASAFTDKIGYKDNDLYGGFYYAELDNGKALGDLAYMTPMKITWKGRSVVAYKGDIGQGGSEHPIVDIHAKTLAALGDNDPDNFLEEVLIEY